MLKFIVNNASNKIEESVMSQSKQNSIGENSSAKIDVAATSKAESGTQQMRGIYLLPNLFTVGALFFGFYATPNTFCKDLQ